MKVGIPREVKNHEYRVAITPSGVHELVRHGHKVFIEKDAGVGSSILDQDYVDAGATIASTADDVWAERAQSYAAKRVLDPAEIAGVVRFLASEEASGVNGEAMTVALGSHW